jgi:hypothetical protein
MLYVDAENIFHELKTEENIINYIYATGIKLEQERIAYLEGTNHIHVVQEFKRNIEALQAEVDSQQSVIEDEDIEIEDLTAKNECLRENIKEEADAHILEAKVAEDKIRLADVETQRVIELNVALESDNIEMAHIINELIKVFGISELTKAAEESMTKKNTEGK